MVWFISWGDRTLAIVSVTTVDGQPFTSSATATSSAYPRAPAAHLRIALIPVRIDPPSLWSPTRASPPTSGTSIRWMSPS